MLPGQQVKATVEQRLERCYNKIIRHDHFKWMCGVLLIGKYRVDDVPTAYTDGVNVVYGRSFCEQWSDAVLRFIILHENYHKMFRHLTVWKHLFKQNAQIANMALDYRINLLIKDYAKRIKDETGVDFIVLPSKAQFPMCLDEKYRGWDEAKIFYDLMKQAKANGGKGGKGEPQSLDQHDWEKASELPAEQQKEMQRQIDEALRQGKIIAGKTGSPGSPEEIGEILAPEVDYREYVREFCKQTCAGREYGSWTRPNRRYMANGVYMPQTLGETIGDVVFALDRSGSCMRDLDKFMSEVIGFVEQVKPNKVHIIYWDTKVSGDVETYDTHELSSIRYRTKPSGGGGTMIEPVCDYIKQHKMNPQCIIVLTDGYLGGSWGHWSQPVLWCVLDNKDATPSMGKVIHINSACFER